MTRNRKKHFDNSNAEQVSIFNVPNAFVLTISCRSNERLASDSTRRCLFRELTQRAQTTNAEGGRERIGDEQIRTQRGLSRCGDLSVTTGAYAEKSNRPRPNKATTAAAVGRHVGAHVCATTCWKSVWSALTEIRIPTALCSPPEGRVAENPPPTKNLFTHKTFYHTPFPPSRYLSAHRSGETALMACRCGVLAVTRYSVLWSPPRRRSQRPSSKGRKRAGLACAARHPP